MANTKRKNNTPGKNRDENDKVMAAETELAEQQVKTEEISVKSKEDLQKELAAITGSFSHDKKEPGAALMALLSSEDKNLADKKESKRSREILGVFAKHNFYANGFTPVELRTTLEDLGPTYVKIGQIMSSRVDMLPESYCKELEKLRQNVKELDSRIARAVIEDETGKKIKDIYKEFRDEPIGSASIGQAHYGVLKDGTRVVTKVQRPLISDMMRKDFVLLKKLAPLLGGLGSGDKSDGGGEVLDLVSVSDELEKVTMDELDFRIEAANTRFFKQYCFEDEKKVTCPTVIEELTTERMFTMTYVDGCSIGKKDKLIAQGCDPVELGRAIVDNYLHQIFDIGVFHGDPHQGNIMVSGKTVYWIDFGAVGVITDGDVNVLQSLILSLVNKDLNGLVNAVTTLGGTSAQTDREKLMQDLDVMITKYMNVTSLNDLDLSGLLEEVLDLCSTHRISLPGKYTMLVRSIATVEGVIEQLCPELNLFEQVSDKLVDRVKKNFSIEKELKKLGGEALDIGKQVIDLPGAAASALSGVMKGKTKINLALTGYEDSLEKISQKINDIVMVLVACVVFFGSCLLCTADIQPKTANGIPLIAAIGLIFSISLGVFSLKKMLKR